MLDGNHILTDYNRVRVQAGKQFQKKFPEFDQIPFLYCYCWRNMGSLFRTCKKTWKQKWQIKQGKSHVVANKPITNRCYTKKTNNALSQDLGMFFYFMIILHHIHLSLWSNFWSPKGLPSCHVHRSFQEIYPFPFPKLKTFLSGRGYKFELPLGSAINKCLRGLLCISNHGEYISWRDVMFI